MSQPPVEPRPAATVVLLRHGLGGVEVLLTHRPSSMVFAPDMHVFPGGRVDATDGDARLATRSVVSGSEAAAALGGDLAPGAALATFVAAIREVFEETGVLLADGAAPAALEVGRAELLHVPGAFAPMVDALDLRLRTDLLVPLSRWVTPPGLPRRFDARFFAAELPAGAEMSLLGGEVAGHAWHTPRAALDEMAAGRLGMWLPTSTTLQQLEHVGSFDEIRARMAPGAAGAVEIDEPVPGVTRITMPWGGGVAGQPVSAYVVGGSSVVLVDPGDPTSDALERVLGHVAERGATIARVALTHAAPDHAAGAEALRDAVDAPVLVGPGGGHDLPYRVDEVADGAVIEAGSMALRAVATPGPAPEHLAFVVEDDGARPIAVIVGDLDGMRGARSLPGPSDDGAWARSVERLRAIAPDVPWLGSHPSR